MDWDVEAAERKERELAAEQAAIADFAAAIRAAVEAGKPLAHWADGNCGYLIQSFKDALASAGLYSEEPLPVRGYSKKPINRSLRTRVFERDAYRCVRCQSWRNLTADHVVPESKGGPATFENLQTLCQSCNSRKGAR